MPRLTILRDYLATEAGHDDLRSVNAALWCCVFGIVGCLWIVAISGVPS